MALFQFTDNNFASIEETTYEEVGKLERDIQTLIKTQPEIISPDTLIVSEEFSPWEDSNNRIDLLGIDNEANLVVIELKRTKDGGYMDLQAVRYAAMVSTMQYDDLVHHYEKFISDNNLEGNAREILAEHLALEDQDSIELGQIVKIVLASPGFSKELTTTVLWLNEQEDLDIRCVRILPHNNFGQILLDVQTIIPLPETKEYQTQLRNRRQSERVQKKAKMGKIPKYNVSFGGQLYSNLNKRKLMYLIFSKLFENDENPENIVKIIPGKTLVFDGLLEDEEVRNRLKLKDRGAKLSRTARFFCENNEPVQHRGKTYILSNQWGKDTLDLVKDLVNEFPNYNIEVSEAESD